MVLSANRKINSESIINEVSTQFNANQFVIKAQIHAGGRGKGGGVKFCPSKEAALEAGKQF